MVTRSLPRRAFVSASLLFVGLACQRGPEKAVPAVKASAPAASPVAKRDVTIFAAASLREAFTTLGKELEATHPAAHVVLSFAGSQALRAQIEQGAPADVFASADQRHMTPLLTAKHVLEPRTFATNELVLVVSKANIATLTELKLLPQAERIVLGAPEVPVGAYTEKALAKASVTVGADFRKRVEAHVVSREPDVRQVLAKVVLGEADAGIVYRTDAMTAGDKVGIVSIPAAFNVVAEYPLAVTSNAPAPELARAFVELVLSPAGQSVLEQQGFLPVNGRGASAR